MARKNIPVYDICSIDSAANRDLLIERFSHYIGSHYHNLQHAHRHSFYHLVLFTSGSGNHTIDFETFPVKAGQIYFMIPGQVHSWNFKKDVDGYIVHFNEALFTGFLNNSRYLQQFSFFSGRATDGVVQITKSEQAGINSIFEDLLAELKDSTAISDMVPVKLLELFIRVERMASPYSSTPAQEENSTVLRNFLQLIDRHYRNLQLPKEYAALLFITPNHLNALCKELLGKTAGDLIRERIILESKRLLTNADMSIAGVAYELNFSDNSYFSRYFKKYTGSSPEDFRKQIHHSNNRS